MTRTDETMSRSGTSRRPALTEAMGAALGYGFLAYVALGMVVPRLLPTDTAEPWPVVQAVYALVLIHLPLATGLTVLWATRGQRADRRLIIHALAVITLVALYLSGLLL